MLAHQTSPPPDDIPFGERSQGVGIARRPAPGARCAHIHEGRRLCHPEAHIDCSRRSGSRARDRRRRRRGLGRASGPHTSQADRLRAIERTRLKALVDADTAKARPLIADDFELINPASAGTFSRKDYLGAVQAGVIDYLVFEPASPIRVRLHGDSASLRFMVNFDLTVGGDRFTHQAWVGELYERRHGHWRIVWEQATAIPNDFDLFAASIRPPAH